ncbi:hypothetical protein CZ787_07985 [Halomonas citrativorans]|uniref:Uncharacterized protein n=1 Tax=Halomonas citrativorans TaxID=2742612 RepID=A0A1R4HY56_9GAMM|nr:hypothetical protein CZ787_07985 [Halomonas citrativorans]
MLKKPTYQVGFFMARYYLVMRRHSVISMPYALSAWIY